MSVVLLTYAALEKPTDPRYVLIYSAQHCCWWAVKLVQPGENSGMKTFPLSKSCWYVCLSFMQVRTLSEKLHENLLSNHLRSILLCHPFVRYQINARTELAVRYNDISPLENHHCAVAFQILSLPECNIFANVDPEAFKKIRQVRHWSCWVCLESFALLSHLCIVLILISQGISKDVCTYFCPDSWKKKLILTLIDFCGMMMGSLTNPVFGNKKVSQNKSIRIHAACLCLLHLGILSHHWSQLTTEVISGQLCPFLHPSVRDMKPADQMRRQQSLSTKCSQGCPGA